MTRETKVGLVVAGSFLCLVCIVVVSKLGRATTPPDDAPDSNNYVVAVDPEKDKKNPIEPVMIEPAKAPPEVNASDRFGSPLHHVENNPTLEPGPITVTATPLGNRLPVAPAGVGAGAVAADPKNQDPPPSKLDFAPLTTTGVVDEPGKPGTVTVSEPTKPTFPPVAEPVKPSFPPVAEPMKPTFPPVAEQLNPSFPPIAEPVKPSIPPVAEPVKPTPPPVAELVEPSFPPVAEPVKPSIPPSAEPMKPTFPPNAELVKPSFPPITEPKKPTFPPVAEPVTSTTIPPPPTLKPAFTNQTVPNAGTGPIPMIPPPSIGLKPEGSITSVPAIPMPETPIVTISVPKPLVTMTAPERVEVNPGESTFAALSKRFYGDEKYAKALQAYNRTHSDGVVNGDNLLQTPPRLNPGQQVILPPRGILERDYRSLIDVAEQPPTIPPVTIAPPVSLARPVAPSITSGSVATTPITINRPTSDRTRAYVVADPAGERLRDIAERLLGDASRWPAIYRLNNVQPQFPIPAGTELRVPVN